MNRRHLPACVVVLLLGLAGLGAVPGTSGRLTGKVTNGTNTAATKVFGSTTSCAQAARDTGAYVAYAMGETSGTVAADSSGNNRAGTYTSTGVSYGAPGPCPRDGMRAVTLDGTNGYVHGPTTTPFFPFSVQLWFRTTTTTGGRLAGFGSGNLLSDTSARTDRHVYMRNDGKLVLGVDVGTTLTPDRRTITSPLSYNDGAWHHVVGTLAPTGAANVGLRLYVDGAEVVSSTGVTTAYNYALGTGMWRFGFDSLTGWANAPTSTHFKGDIAFGAVWSTALTAAQVTNLHYTGR